MKSATAGGSRSPSSSRFSAWRAPCESPIRDTLCPSRYSVAPAMLSQQAHLMTVSVSHTTIDCHDAYSLSEWWKKMLGYTDIPGDPNERGDEECMIIDPDTDHRLLFVEVPDADLPAKRIHFDVRPRQRSRDDEVDHLLAHGATLAADHRGIHGPGSGWMTLSDPEGNQFCVLRSQGELDAEQ